MEQQDQPIQQQNQDSGFYEKYMQTVAKYSNIVVGGIISFLIVGTIMLFMKEAFKMSNLAFFIVYFIFAILLSGQLGKLNLGSKMAYAYFNWLERSFNKWKK